METIQVILAFAWLGCTLAMLYFIIRALRRKENWRRAGLAFLGGFASLAVGIALTPKAEASTSVTASPPSKTPVAVNPTKPDPQIAQLKAQLAKAEAEKRAAEAKAAKAQQDMEAAKSAPASANSVTSSDDTSESENGVKTYHISSEDYFGCVNKDDFEKAVKYAVERDAEAFQQFLGAGLATGLCTTFEKGQIVYVEHSALFSGAVKVRPQGETASYWTNLEAVE